MNARNCCSRPCIARSKRKFARRRTVADACEWTCVQLLGESPVPSIYMLVRRGFATLQYRGTRRTLKTTTFQFSITTSSVTREYCRSKSGSAPRFLCLLQNDEGIGWNPEVDPTVSRGQITAEVADIVPAIDGGVAVEQFPPLPIGQSP